MLTLKDINNIESDNMIDDLEYYQSIQRAINAGAWSFQGSYGRAMMDAINAGYCMLGTKRARDCYGNTIPSRDDVEDSTKGSFNYVRERLGFDWASEMEVV